MSRPFAVFDLDGTLIRWQLYHAMVDELVRQGHLDASQYAAVKAARMAWKRRDNTISFREYESTMIKLVDVGIVGLALIDLTDASQRVITEYKDQVYTYTRDLMSELRAKNYLLFAISASPSILVDMIAEHYCLDDAAGSSYETNAGFFTGEKDLLLSERKVEVLQQIIAKHDATMAGSIAVGDSEGDIPMLSIVEQPIAFNPTQELFNHAHEQQWKIVVERKNVVYKLEPHDGSYLLA